MESRHPNKNLSDTNSVKNAYADILSGPANLGPQKVLQDYNLIFCTSNASSIPVLDLYEEDVKMSRFVDFSSSELDYSHVFRGLNDDEAIGVSYQDLQISSSNARTQSVTRYPLNSSERSTFPEENQLFTSEVSFQSIDDKKRFTMSYHKTRAGSKDGSSGTIHVAQFHPEPGFTYFVNGSTMQESKVDKPEPSVTSDTRRKLDFSDDVLESKYTKKGMPHLHTQKSSRREDGPRTRLYEGASYSSDRLLHAHGINLTPHPTNERLPPRVTANLENNNGFKKRSMASNSKASRGIASQHAADDNSLPFFGEEFDVNSAAAVSAAALKNAIQKAEESIRIAKELMERKMGGLRNRSDRVFEGGLRVKDRKENSITHIGNRTEDINAEDTCETVDSVLNFLSGRRKSTSRHEQDAPDSKDDEITFNSWKVTSDVHAQNRPETGKREPAVATILNVGKNRTSSLSPDQMVGSREIAQFMKKHEHNSNEKNITSETLIKQEFIGEKEEEDEKALERKKLHADVTEKESAENVDKLSKHVEMEKPLIFQEDRNHVKTGIESQQKIEYERKYDTHDLRDTDFVKMIHITRKQDQSKQQANSEQEDMEKTTVSFDDIHEYRPRIICDDDIEEERFEDACEWVQNEDEPNDFFSSVSNETEANGTYMAEVTERGRTLERIHVPTNEEKRSIDVHDFEKSGVKLGELKLVTSKNGFKSYGYEEHENKQIGTNEIGVLQRAQNKSSVNRGIYSWSHDTSDNITETQGTRQPCMIDEISETEQVNNTSIIIDNATNNVHDFKVGEAGETKVASKLNKIEPFEPAIFIQGGAEDSETRKNTNTVFEVLPSEGSIPKVGLTDMDLKNSEAEHRDKDFESNINPDNDPRISVSRYIENDYAFAEGGNHCDEEAVKSRPRMSDGEVQHVVIMKNFKAYSRPSVSSENEEVVQVDEEMRARRNTQMNGKSLCKNVSGEEEETKIEDTPKVLFAMEGTETKKEKSKAPEEKEYLRKVYEESKRERQREIDRIAVGRIIQEARDRAFAGARGKAERATVDRTTAEVQQRLMAETHEKLEKATTAVKPSAEKASIEAKLRSERVAVQRATEEARERALEKALFQKTTSRTQVLQTPDDTYIESAQRSKARLERQERIMERVAKALAEKNMRDLLAQKEEAEKKRLAESLDAQIKRWSTGKEGNLRALLSTLQYILGPGNGWQPISLTDIITSNAVKKAYRKATLYVHPDKLQQRGASIREKYICEKVFDLLKVGWARFNSEER